MKDIWYVYICQAQTGRYYTGITKNPENRLKSHNKKSGSQFARDEGHFAMVYISKPFSTKSEARKKEMQVKGWVRAKKEKLISGDWL